MKAEIGIIGGSGLYHMPGFEAEEEAVIALQQSAGDSPIAHLLSLARQHCPRMPPDETTRPSCQAGVTRGDFSAAGF